MFLQPLSKSIETNQELSPVDGGGENIHPFPEKIIPPASFTIELVLNFYQAHT